MCANTPSLTIFYAELSDAGIYTCFASKKQQSADRHLSPLGQIMPIPGQPVFALSP
jgi:hypothetical protein